MLQALIDICAPGTRVCIASNLTLPTERILTRTTRDWKTAAFPDIEKQPTVFLLQA
jgi:16S rRNA (cytidine1402-2'-O)-methyltransferase